MPLASEIFVWLTPVATLVRVTVASPITAPELSRTVPTIDAVSNWADAEAAERIRNTVARTAQRIRFMGV